MQLNSERQKLESSAFMSFERRPATAAIAPSAIVEIDLSFDNIQGQKAIDVLNGTADLYVWGTIFYSDVFGVDRETNFRMKYYFRKNQEAGLFRATIEGNEAT